MNIKYIILGTRSKIDFLDEIQSNPVITNLGCKNPSVKTNFLYMVKTEIPMLLLCV